jgi:hypothetical protein
MTKYKTPYHVARLTIRVTSAQLKFAFENGTHKDIKAVLERLRRVSAVVLRKRGDIR